MKKQIGLLLHPQNSQQRFINPNKMRINRKREEISKICNFCLLKI